MLLGVRTVHRTALLCPPVTASKDAAQRYCGLKSGDEEVLHPDIQDHRLKCLPLSSMCCRWMQSAGCEGMPSAGACSQNCLGCGTRKESKHPRDHVAVAF